MQVLKPPIFFRVLVVVQGLSILRLRTQLGVFDVQLAD